MSFSFSVKNEVSRIEITDESELLAELAAIIRMNGTIQLKSLGKVNLKLTTENAATARRMFKILKDLYNKEIDVVVKRNRQLKKTNIYIIVISNSDFAQEILEDIRFIDKDSNNILRPNYKIDNEIIKNLELKKSYIRGSFLGGGSVSNPEKSYHLEFTTNNQIHAEDLSKIVNSFNLNSKVIKRKESYVVYLKEAEQIGDVLNIIGAHQNLLKLQDIRILKDMRNNVNRIVNCETANLDKTVSASMRQVENIKYIDEVKGIDELPPKLREVAYLRLDNRNATLKEIGEMLDPPVSKSGVNHRFRKIEKIAKEIKGV